jgi:RNA polymerase sigma-54 factor
VLTPRGLFAWKFFFQRAYAASAGPFTPAWIKDLLKELIASEDKARPLSDQQLVELLALRGMQLARRTVAKYREELGIGASQFRRCR